MRCLVYASKRLRGVARDVFPETEILSIEKRSFGNGAPNIEIPGLEREEEAKSAYCFFHLDSLENIALVAIILQVLAETRRMKRLVLLPLFDCNATMERVDREGVVATANVFTKMLGQVPPLLNGRRLEVFYYDVHTLQQRFYAAQPAQFAHLHFPVDFGDSIDVVVFPDEGAKKRFAPYYQDKYAVACCSKERKAGAERAITVSSGAEHLRGGKRVLIVDDLVHSGGTLLECSRVLTEQYGAVSVDVFVTHADFNPGAWKRFTEELSGTFHTTDTCGQNQPWCEHPKFIVHSVASHLRERLLQD